MKYIDLGLPSGILWADSNEEGYYNFDEAVEKYGNGLPTKEQWEELKNLCQWEWMVRGYKVTGPNGKSIVLPVAGYRSCNGFVHFVNSLGFYWSSSPNGSENAWDLCFYYCGVDMDDDNQGYGFSIRLVK